ncbi:GntR family transcriptional regulator [Planifilum fimeticola]
MPVGLPCEMETLDGDSVAKLQKENLKKGSTREFIYQTLRDKILRLELKPGIKISEAEISEQLKVSRTPVRESFLKLSQEDLLEIYPQKGTFVSLIDLDLVEEGRFVRENIERAIVRVACDSFSDEHLFQLETNLKMQEICNEKQDYTRLYRLDDEFHKLLFFGCGKIRTWNMLQQMNTHFNRMRHLRLLSSLEWDVIVAQHQEIFRLINDKRKDQAEEAMIKHLRLAVMEIDLLTAQYPEYFRFREK